MVTNTALKNGALKGSAKTAAAATKTKTQKLDDKTGEKKTETRTVIKTSSSNSKVENAMAKTKTPAKKTAGTGKKKEEVAAVDKMLDDHETLKTAVQQIEAQFGTGSIMALGNDSKQEIRGISTGSLSLDMALGGSGLPCGRIIEIYGPESSGKTTLALHTIAEAQKTGGIAAIGG